MLISPYLLLLFIMNELKTKQSFQLPVQYAEQLKLLAEGVHRTPSALTRELIISFCEGRIKLPMPEMAGSVYETSSKNK